MCCTRLFPSVTGINYVSYNNVSCVSYFLFDDRYSRRLLPPTILCVWVHYDNHEIPVCPVFFLLRTIPLRWRALHQRWCLEHHAPSAVTGRSGASMAAGAVPKSKFCLHVTWPLPYRPSSVWRWRAGACTFFVSSCIFRQTLTGCRLFSPTPAFCAHARVQ